ncbi:hydroxyacid dehydrogenase [candidate division KSB1 bacterium]|nr:hydroxyacid dehydrogenase [candidate division KSB1 bacterium]
MAKTNKPDSQIIIYQTESGKTKIEVRLQDETVWLTQKLMAELFQVGVNTINYHIKEIYEEGELSPDPTIRKFRIVQKEGQRDVVRLVDFYNLDMIISVGYRVKSHVATRFRQWATQRLREYIVKGFTLDDERLKNPDQPFDYFDELLRRIQDIRTSERRFYQKITDIYATSIDYDPTLTVSIDFFKTVQNKMHWAITGQTAAEIVHNRADASKPNMGLSSWRGDKVRKQDVTIAKNYLNEKELSTLNNLVEQYLVFAEGQAMRRIPMTMQNWIEKLNGFLQLNDRNILTHAGKISHELAAAHAEDEYEKFIVKRISAQDKMDSDFDKTVKRLEQAKKKLSRKKPGKGKSDSKK